MSRILMIAVALSCSKGDGLYAACEEPADCDVAAPEESEPACLEKEGEGFCTWTCQVDADCEETHDEDYDYVCASFEEESGTYCFPDCKEDDEDAGDVCPPRYECRSTGGGVNQRRVCFPG